MYCLCYGIDVNIVMMKNENAFSPLNLGITCCLKKTKLEVFPTI